MTLPRSLAHPPRPPNASYSAVGPPRANYGQMHVLEQQELQSQMQQRGRVQQLQGGLPPRSVSGPGGGYLPNPPPGQQQQQYGSPMSQPPPGNSQQQPHAPGGVQPPLMGPPHYQQPQQPPPGPPSSAGSPHMVPASHPYANGRQQGPPGAPGGSANPAFQAAMAAVGLAGRDPEMLSNEEHVRLQSRCDVPQLLTISLPSGCHRRPDEAHGCASANFAELRRDARSAWWTPRSHGAGPADAAANAF